MKSAGVLLLVAYAFVLSEADPTACYDCDVFDLNKCTSPLNLDTVTVKSCSQIDTWGYKNTTDKVICFHTQYDFLGLAVNERGCYYAEMENQDFCVFRFRTSGVNVMNFKCKTCNTTKCNDD